MTITPLAGTNQITTALTALGTTAFGDSETDLYKQLLVALSEGGPWTPADIADLAIFFWFKPGVDCCYQNIGGAASGAGNRVGYAAPLFGASISARVDNIAFRPTLQSDGLQLDAGGSRFLSFSSQFAATDITAYWSMIVDSASTVACFASDTLEDTLIGGNGDVSIYDNFGIPFASPRTTGAVILGRFNMDEENGNYSMISTGQSENAGTETNFGFNFNQIGGTGAIGSGNDSTANRFRLVIAIKRSIVLGSAEDLLIRNWITTYDGASL